VSERVLVVDDSLTVRMDLEEAFSAGGFATALAADLAEARRALSGGGVALVVLDVLLPDGDGIDLLGEIRRAPELAAIPVVLLSTEAEVRHRIRGLQTGADDYVGKPYDAASLVARARALVRRRAAGRAEAKRGPVLVVDDSLTAREALRADLEGAGLEVATAASAEEGLRAAADLRPSAVVVDGVMEGMDGATFVFQLRADAVLRATPCILLTAGGAGGELPALEAGADAYVRKEEGHAVVLARLQTLLRTAAPAIAVGTAGLLAPKRILALGEEREGVRQVLDRLRQDGHEVVPATFSEAPQLAGLHGVDGIVLDGGTDFAAALAACRRLRDDEAWRGVPLLLLVRDEDPARTVEAMNAGADDCVALASGLDVVRARIRALLRRKQLDDENRSREVYARNAAILETIADAFFAVDREWRLTYVNHAFEELLGATRAAVAGASIWERCPWLAEGAPADELRRAVRERGPVTFEAHVPGDRWVELRAFPHEAGLSAHLRDVTERRRSQEVQAHLLGIVGHDLRTPLTALSASAGLVLRDADLPERHRRALDRVVGASARMARLINDLLDYSRARLGHGMPILPRPANLDALCTEVLDDVRAAHPGRRIEYRHAGDGKGVWDAGRMGQVLTNLLTNALRYGDQETVVTLAWRGGPDEKVVSVHNHGLPMDPRLLEHAFEPFRRGDASGNAWGGVGLGLYIVNQIVLAHGGSVVVRSAEGSGTTFTVTFPTDAARAEAANRL
jgi:two-component system NtrC family sensor kinase